VDMTLRGNPEAVLLVEFAGDDGDEQRARLAQLNELMAQLRLPGSVVDVVDPQRQAAIWNVRKAGLNIMMSMRGDGKPVSFIEDCAVPLEHLAEYTLRLTRVFEKYGTRGTWYAHASVGCLHVRPVLDMRTQSGADKMRAIAEEACALVREYKGSYSGEHGDGLVRSEWIEPIYGARLTRALAEIKQEFDPVGIMNPGKIVQPSRMDQRELFRFPPDHRTLEIDTALDWSEFEVGQHNSRRGFAAALEMCNNNGHCRKFDAGTMCPSYRVTRNERDLTRGRANALRLAMSGALGEDALTSQDMYETMSLCVSCKGCRRECPTGIDMARMKIEFLNQYHRITARSRRDILIAHLPRYAPWMSRLAPIANLRDVSSVIARMSEGLTGLSSRRRLPSWKAGALSRLRRLAKASAANAAEGREVVLLPDTFDIYFEPKNLAAAARVLKAAGYQVVVAVPNSGRPLCCGRTYLASGMVEDAREEARRTLAVIAPYARRGVPIVGLEPSCLFGYRDEIPNLLPGEDADAVAKQAMTLAQFIMSERRSGNWQLDFAESTARRALVHGHCHEKSFDAFEDVLEALRLIPNLEVEAVQSSCCGMAGSFGHCVEHYDVSMAMAEAALLPAVRSADPETIVVADGTSCRHQIKDGASREAMHLARVLAEAI
ncbi:MAG: FAD-linked oxidase C-terminal domain-containing protein, partial [Gammaproteobacteria bacterium]